MTLTTLFKKRQTIYYKKLSKYLKYVLNDHFVLALLLLGGALGFSYSEYVKTIPAQAVMPRFILILLLFGFLSIGKIRTLIEPADSVFLLPKEKELTPIMLKNLRYACFFFSVIIALLGFMTLPLLAAVLEMTTLSNVLWILTLIIWKGHYLVQLYQTLRNEVNKKQTTVDIIVRTLPLLGLGISVFYSIIIGFVFSLLVFIPYAWKVLGHQGKTQWNWESLIETEKKRVQGIYRLINLFIETPYFNNKVRRFKVFDGLFALRMTKKTAYTYYLSRVFVRNTEFSGLYSRLTVIGTLFIYFTENTVVNVMISLLFLYLIGFQLLPLNQIIEQSIQFKLYPSEQAVKIKSIQTLLFYLLTPVAIFFILATINSGWDSVLTLILANSAFTIGFVSIYSPKRLAVSR